MMVEPQAAPNAPTSNPVVAIVEDQQAIAEMLVELLGMHHFHAELIAFPVVPANIVETGASVLLLDVMLPERSGWEVLETLRQDATTRDLPVIVTSAVYDRPGLHALPGGGPIRFAPKPFDINQLVALIHKMIDAAPPGETDASH